MDKDNEKEKLHFYLVSLVLLFKNKDKNKDMPAQYLRGAHKVRVCVSMYVFIGMSVSVVYMSAYVHTVLEKRIKN